MNPHVHNRREPRRPSNPRMRLPLHMYDISGCAVGESGRTRICYSYILSGYEGNTSHYSFSSTFCKPISGNISSRNISNLSVSTIPHDTTDIHSLDTSSACTSN